MSCLILITFKCNLQTCIVFATLIQIQIQKFEFKCILNSNMNGASHKKRPRAGRHFINFHIEPCDFYLSFFNKLHFSWSVPPVERLERGNSPESNWSINSLIYFDLAKRGRVQQHSAGPLIINNDLSIIHKTFSGICGALPRLCVLQRGTQTHTHTLCSTSHLHAHVHTLLHHLSFFYRPILLLPC